MKDNNIHITNVEELLNKLEQIKDSEARQTFIEKIEALETDNEALQGAIMFLKDNDWNIDLLKSMQSNLDKRVYKTIKDHSAKKRISIVFRAAAAILIPLGFFGYYQLTTPTASIDQFFLEEPGLPNYMGSNSPRTWEQVMDFYKKKEYAPALEALNDLKDTTNDNDTLTYFMGVVKYQLEDFQSAASFFIQVARQKNSSFFFDAEYRLGFALYKAGDKKKAKEQFEKIESQKNHPFYSDASRILTSIF